MKKAVVTGASGFLGSYLCADLILNGYTVVAFFHTKEPLLFARIAKRLNLQSKHITWVKVDLSDPEAICENIKEAEVVFHCAAKVSFKKSDFSEIMHSNVECTKNLVNACSLVKVPNLIFASSVAAMGRKEQNNEINEDSDWIDGDFNTPYAVSKHLAELEVWRGAEEGLNVGIINPGIILGAGDGKTGSNQIFEHIRKGNMFYPAGTNGFVGVKDCAKMMRLVFEKSIFGQRIIAVSENVSYAFVLTIAAKAMNLKPPTRKLDGLLFAVLYSTARLFEKLHLPFPFPSSGLKSTRSVNIYTSIRSSLKTFFEYTPIEKVIIEAVEELK